MYFIFWEISFPWRALYIVQATFWLEKWNRHLKKETSKYQLWTTKKVKVEWFLTSSEHHAWNFSFFSLNFIVCVCMLGEQRTFQYIYMHVPDVHRDQTHQNPRVEVISGYELPHVWGSMYTHWEQWNKMHFPKKKKKIIEKLL